MQTRNAARLGRRILLKKSTTARLLNAPAIIAARGETMVRIGMVDPLTAT